MTRLQPQITRWNLPFLCLATFAFACASVAHADFAAAMKTAQEHLEAGRPEEARAGFEAALKDAATADQQAGARIGIGRAFDAGKQPAEAITEFEKALAIEGIPPAHAADALLAVARCHLKNYQNLPAHTALKGLVAMDGAPAEVKAQGFLEIARIFNGYTGEYGSSHVREACENVLAMPDSTDSQKLDARKRLARAWLVVQQYGDARKVLREILDTPSLSAEDRIATQILCAKVALLDRNFEGAREELNKASALEGLSDGDRADIQLQLALSYYEAGDHERAKPELLTVRDMPGAGDRRNRPGIDNTYTPGHEAFLRLRLQKMIPAGEEPALNVLFIGSSMTMRGDMPSQLSGMAASAPEDRPRIVPGLFGRGGTKIDTFWNDGEGPGTARNLIAGEPWDAVVIETFYNLKPGELQDFGTQFVDLVRSKKARPVFYVAPAAQAHEYPDAHRAFEDSVLELAKTLDVPVAPAVGAYLEFLGPNPTPEKLGILYSDWIHPTEKGTYLIQCCIYAALTDSSPVGLAHPGISDEEAKTFQETAWKAYQDSRKSGGGESKPGGSGR